VKTAVLGLATALVLAAGAAAASAQPAPDQLDAKDPGTATLLSIGGTVAPLALVAAGAGAGAQGNGSSGALLAAGIGGLVIGPSLGEWYAHDYFSPGLGLRGAGAALIIAGLGCFNGIAGPPCPPRDNSGTAVAVIGAVVIAGGTLCDLLTAGRSAREWNAAHVRVVPTVIGSAGRQTVGVGLGGNF
jgi:hypothetical protein